MNRVTLGMPGLTTDVRQSRAAKHGGQVRASGAAALAQEKLLRREALREYVRATVARIYGGAIPPLEGGLLFREMSERKGVPESVLAGLAVELGVWNRSALAVISAWKLSEDRRETKGATI